MLKATIPAFKPVLLHEHTELFRRMFQVQLWLNSLPERPHTSTCAARMRQRLVRAFEAICDAACAPTPKSAQQHLRRLLQHLTVCGTHLLLLHSEGALAASEMTFGRKLVTNAIAEIDAFGFDLGCEQTTPSPRKLDRGEHGREDGGGAPNPDSPPGAGPKPAPTGNPGLTPGGGEAAAATAEAATVLSAPTSQAPSPANDADVPAAPARVGESGATAMGAPSAALSSPGADSGASERGKGRKIPFRTRKR